jgi:hypothetical protein
LGDDERQGVHEVEVAGIMRWIRVLGQEVPA